MIFKYVISVDISLLLVWSLAFGSNEPLKTNWNTSVTVF